MSTDVEVPDELPGVAEAPELVDPGVAEPLDPVVPVDPVVCDLFAWPLRLVGVEPDALVAPVGLVVVLLDRLAFAARTFASVVSAVASDFWSVATWVSAMFAVRRAPAHIELDDSLASLEAVLGVVVMVAPVVPVVVLAPVDPVEPVAVDPADALVHALATAVRSPAVVCMSVSTVC